MYSEVPNRQADWNKKAGLEKNATLLAYLLSKSINEQGGIFRLLREQEFRSEFCLEIQLTAELLNYKNTGGKI